MMRLSFTLSGDVFHGVFRDDGLPSRVPEFGEPIARIWPKRHHVAMRYGQNEAKIKPLSGRDLGKNQAIAQI